MSRTKKNIQIKKTSPFEEMTILTQKIEKENKNIVLYENFHIRPNSINTVPDKVHVDPKKYIITGQTTKGIKTEKLGKDVLDYLDRCFQVPKKKYPYPLTENQKIGWYHNYVN